MTSRIAPLPSQKHPARILSGFFLTLTLLAAGCGPTTPTPPTSSSPNVTIRVRLLPGVTQISLSSPTNPSISMGDDPTKRPLIFPHPGDVSLTRTPTGWRIGSAEISAATLIFWPSDSAALSVNQTPYRGSLRLVPSDTASNQFDVINDVQVDDYLKGVLACELYHPWQLQAYKCQAVVARTYALYQSHTEGLTRYWDVWPDERSQVYGGLSAETDKSRQAVDQTAGLVLTYGPGDGAIFQAFFSSDSGGITQSAEDAFGTGEIPPLSAHPEPNYGTASPYHNWGPITITREELTRRIRAWAIRRTPPRPESNMAVLTNVQAAAFNPYGRTRAFRLTDANGQTFFLPAEEMRSAFNTTAPPGPGNSLPSSFCKARTPPDQDTVIFFDGHGYGHGVGMSQWTAQERAASGEAYDAILLSSYPQAKLVRAY